MCHTPLESYDSQDSSCVCEEMGCREDMREINERSKQTYLATLQGNSNVLALSSVMATTLNQFMILQLFKSCIIVSAIKAIFGVFYSNQPFRRESLPKKVTSETFEIIVISFLVAFGQKQDKFDFSANASVHLAF